MSSTPGPQSSLAALAPVPGQLPDLRRADLPACRFLERCERATSECASSLPLLDANAEHAVACWHPMAAPAPEVAHG